MARCYISIGSNIEPAAHVRGCAARLCAAFGEVAFSPVYACAAVGFIGADFLNLAAGFDAAQPPAEVIALLRGIEQAQGRVRGGPRGGSRTLDLDLLTYGALVQDTPQFKLPRPEILHAAHVLRPLADLAGAEQHPVIGVTYAMLWKRMAPCAPDLRRVDLDLHPI